MTRRCGQCTLCCKLLPVPEIKKPATTRCAHQRFGKGCSIYARRPLTCQLWSCRWLIGDVADDLSRPDISHYVIDPMPDFVTMTFDDAAPVRVPVIQIWLDRRFPDAHRDPALRVWLESRAEEGFAAIMRWDNNEAFVVFPPAMSSDGQWHEQHSAVKDQQHSQADIAATLTEVTGEPYTVRLMDLPK
jgi:hypothetical protein